MFVGADGGREWGSFTLPFTNNKARGRNLLRQFVEQSRAGMILQYTGKARLWPLEVGDRVAVTSGRFGLVADTFRVLDWSWSPGQPVALTLQRDIAASYDDADASTADPAPATRLPNPGLVDTPSELAAASGTAQLLKMADGTIIPRVLLSWTAPKTIYMSDPSARTLVSWRRAAEATWTEFPLAGNTTETCIDGVRDRDVIIIRVQHLNSFGVGSAWVAIAHSVIGKTAPPTSPTALAVMETAAAVRRYTVTHAQDVDHGGYIVRFSSTLTATFDQMTQVCARWDGDSLISEASSPLDGAYRFGVAAFDTTGNLSSAAAYVTATLSGLAALGDAADAAAAAAAAASAAAAAASAAQTIASSALTRANAANTALASIASDSILSPSEKPDVVQDYTVLTAEQSGIDGQAGVYGITTERAAYNAAITALTSYLGSLPGWNTIPGGDVAIVGTDFRAKFAAVYAARQTLLNKISDVAKSLADAAQATGSAAATAAAAAQTAASAAQNSATVALTRANTANAALASIASDSVLSPSEKPEVVQDYTVLTAEQPGIDGQAGVYGITTERAAYNTSIADLTTYLGTLPGWNTLPGVDVAIVGVDFRAKFAAVYAARQTLLNKISAVAKSLADAAQGSATGAQAAANAARTAATTAQDLANTALGQLQAIASDGILSRGEKASTIVDWTELWNSRQGIIDSAAAYGIASAAFTGALTALANHLTALSPGWSDTSQDTAIIPATWRALWDAAYQSRTTLLNAIAARAKSLADAAQGSANGAQAAASAAQTAANAARTAALAAQDLANTALGQLQAIASDGILSRGEKAQVIIDWSELWNGQIGIVTTANSLSIVSERDAYTGAVVALSQYLLSLSPGWSDTSQDTVIIPAIWRSNWDFAYQKRQTLLNRIAVVSSQRADWLSVGNRPENVAALVGGEDINNAKLGQASNLINCQTEFAENTTAGWDMAGWIAGQNPIYLGAELARDATGAWCPIGGNALTVAQGARVTGDDAAIFGVALTSKLIPIEPGIRYCASAFVAAHRCFAALHLEFKTAVGGNTGGGASATTTEVGGGKSLSGWQRLSVFATAPADAVAVRLLFAKRNTWAGQSNSFGWMTRPMIELAGAAQTVPSAYSPSAATSHAQLGVINTGDIAPGAATEVRQVNAPGPVLCGSLSGANKLVISLPAFTPTESGKVIVTASFDAATTLGSGNTWTTWFEVVNAGGGYMTLNDNAIGVDRQRYHCSSTFDAVAGQAIYLSLNGGYNALQASTTFWNVELRAELIKR
ncbi:hypothetical protein [uncultured Sphaerotilus sp.]|uniref:hypothetical protein n=1 Tax=uncultured Sphaerotilus sp. TaxID=474984 RepID=UPI0030CA44BA